MENIYPAVNEDIVFRLAAEQKVTFIPQSHVLKIISYHAWQVYRLCDGTRKISEIRNELSKDWNIEENELIFFLKDALGKGYMKFNERPIKSKINILGNENDYTPDIIQFSLTEQCNLNCVYCYANSGPQKNVFFDFSAISKLFKEFSSKGVCGIELTGGEPLLHNKFYEILELALINFNFISIISNGVLFTDKIISLLNKNKQKCFVQISIDGATEEINFKIRGQRNTWDKTLNTIKSLVNNNIRHRIAYMLTQDNMCDVEQAFEIMKKIGVKSIAVSPIIGVGRGCKNDYSTIQDFDNKAIDLLKNIYKKYNDIYFSIFKIRETRYKDFVNSDSENCGAGWRSVGIKSTGDVIACTLLGKISKIGNIFSDKMDNIFSLDNPQFKFYKNFKKTDNQEECCSCDFNAYCSQCLTKVYIANRERQKNGKHFCKFAQKFDMDKYLDFNCTFDYSMNQSVFSNF